MIKNPFFKEAILSLVVLWLAHMIAIKFYLYWVYWWFDILMHFWGGVVVALGAVWFLRQKSFVKLLLITLFIAIIWEVFEYYSGIALTGEENYWVDTITDIIMASIGTTVAFLYIKKKING